MPEPCGCGIGTSLMRQLQLSVWLKHLEIFTSLLCQIIIDLGVSGKRSTSS
jgi:hypothetical protein